MNLMIAMFAVAYMSIAHLCAMEKPHAPSHQSTLTSYLQLLPPDLWAELFLHMSDPGNVIDNRADIIMQTHANARKVAQLACEYMNLKLSAKIQLNENFIHASEAYCNAHKDQFASFYLPNEISLVCALNTPGSREMLKKNLASMMENFRMIPQREKNKMLFDVMRRCPSKTIVSALIKNGAQVNARNETSDFTPLRYAIENGKKTMVRKLLRHGAVPEFSDRHKTNSLMRAVILGQTEIVTLLAPKTKAINAMNLFGQSALSYAVQRGYFDMVKCLINNGAKVMRSDESGEKNIYVAAVNSGNPQMLRLILSVEEPDSNNGFLYDSFMSSAFKRAAELGNPDMIHEFISNVDNLKSPSGFRPTLRPDALHSDGLSPLTAALARHHTLIAIDLIKFARERYDKSVGVFGVSRNLALAWATSKLGELQEDRQLREQYKYIIDLMMKDDNPNPLDNTHCPSACFFAAFNGNELLVHEFLLLARAHTDHCKERALFEAVEKCSAPAVRTILKTNPDVNWINEKGDTVLLNALKHIGHEQLEIFDRLLAAGADVSKADNAGTTAIHIIISNKDSKARKYMISELFERGIACDAQDEFGDTPLLLAAVKKIPMNETAELLLSYGANPNHANAEGNTPLIYAAGHNNQALVLKLLEYNADPNKRNNSGCGPLTKAARVNNFHITQHLVQAGARIDDFKDGMLRGAAKGDHEELMEALLARGANINSGSSSLGNTPLHKAVLKGSMNAVKLLLRHKANVTCKNRKGETALELAIALNDSAICRILTEHH